MAMGAAAEDHSFFWEPKLQDYTNWVEADSNADEADPTSMHPNNMDYTMVPWWSDMFDDVCPMIKGTSLSKSAIYEDNTTDLIPRQQKLVEANAEKVYGTPLVPVMENGILTAASDEDGTMYYPTNFPPSPISTGRIIFHCVLGSKSSVKRINDAENYLSPTGERAYLKDLTGVRVGLKAPKYATVNVYLSTPNISEKNLGGFYDGEPYAEAMYGKMSTIAFDLGEITTDDYCELTSGAPYNALAGMNPITAAKKSWPDGYCVKFVDIVVSNIRPGQKVGIAGIQTLYDGLTKTPFAAASGIETIGVDNNANAPVEYFNIQGMQVSADNLTPGLYIKRQGTETTKVIVK